MKLRAFLWFGLIAVILMGLVAAPACSPKSSEKENFIRLHFDREYDYDFVLLELKSYDVSVLKEWVRPIITRVTDEEGQFFMECRGMGILLDQYVVTAFSAVPDIPEELPPIPGLPDEPPIELLPLPKLESQTFLVWGILDLEPLELVFSEEGTDVVILKRTDTTKHPIAPLSYYQMGKPEDLKGLEKLITIGFEDFLGKGNLAIAIREASFTAHWQDQRGFLLQNSIPFTDFGAPVFAIRDGQPELGGMVVASGAALGVETQALAININYIAQILKEKVGIDIMK